MSKLLESIIDQLKLKITKGKYDQTFQLLEEILVKGGTFNGRVDGIKSRINTLKTSGQKGAITEQQFIAGQNGIQADFREIVSELKEEDLDFRPLLKDETASTSENDPTKAHIQSISKEEGAEAPNTKLTAKRFSILSAILLVVALVGWGAYASEKLFKGGEVNHTDPGEQQLDWDKDERTLALQDTMDSLEKQLEVTRKEKEEVKQELEDYKGTDSESIRKLRKARDQISELEEEVTKLTSTKNDLAEKLKVAQGRPAPPKKAQFPGVTLLVHGKLSKSIIKKLAHAGIYTDFSSGSIGMGNSLSYHGENEAAANYISSLVNNNIFGGAQTIKPKSDGTTKNEIKLYID